MKLKRIMRLIDSYTDNCELISIFALNIFNLKFEKIYIMYQEISSGIKTKFVEALKIAEV